MTTFHDRINELYEEHRDKNHRTGRTEFARICGVTYGQINGWLSRKGEPNSETMKMIAEKFNVSVGWLTGETDIRSCENFSMLKNLSPGAVKDLHEYLDYLKFKYKIHK